MTHIHATGVAERPARLVTERENERAVELIESAERSAPYCLCGRHMLAVADDEAIWLECSSRSERKSGLAGVFARITAFSHSRRMIMELPATD